MSQNLHDRIDRLEVHIAEQDRMLQDMSEVMTKQWASLDLLGAKLDRLLDRIGSLESEGPAPDNSPPPHY